MSDKQKKTRQPKMVRSTIIQEHTSSAPALVNEVITTQSKSAVNKSYYIHAKWEKSSFLKNAVEATKDIIVQTNMDWTEEGISIQGMDPSHVALSNVFLSKEDCYFYHIKESITIGIDMIRLGKILTIANADDSLEFFIENEEEATINVTLTSVDEKCRSHFQIPLIDIDVESLNIPDMIYDNKIIQKSNDFASAVRDLGFLGDVVAIWVDGGEFHIQVRGEFGMGERAWKDGILKSSETNDNRQSYPLRYLLKTLKGTSVSSDIQIEFSLGSPIRLSYTFGNSSNIINYVAPKLDDSDE